MRVKLFIVTFLLPQLSLMESDVFSFANSPVKSSSNDEEDDDDDDVANYIAAFSSAQA